MVEIAVKKTGAVPNFLVVHRLLLISLLADAIMNICKICKYKKYASLFVYKENISTFVLFT